MNYDNLFVETRRYILYLSSKRRGKRKKIFFGRNSILSCSSFVRPKHTIPQYDFRSSHRKSDTTRCSTPFETLNQEFPGYTLLYLSILETGHLHGSSRWKMKKKTLHFLFCNLLSLFYCFFSLSLNRQK